MEVLNMKVKYIAEPYGHDYFEKEINDFIKDKKIIDFFFKRTFHSVKITKMV